MLPRSAYLAVSVLILTPSALLAQPASLIVKNDSGALPEGARLRLGKVAGLRYAGPASSASMSPDGKILAVASGNGNTIALVDVATGKTLHTLAQAQFGGGLNGMTFSADSSTLAVQDYQSVRVWDVATGKSLQQVQSRDGIGGRNFGPSMSKDGKIVGVGSERFAKNNQTGEVKAIEVATGKVLGPYETLHNYNIRVAVAPDGKTMASWGNHLNRGGGVPDQMTPRTIQLWELASGKELKKIIIEQPILGAVQTAVFAPDGKTLAVASGTATFHLVDVETGKENRRFAGMRNQGTTALRFSPDGQMLATYDLSGTLQVWNVATGKRLELADAPRTQLLAVAFPGKDRVIAMGMLAQSLCWWDATDLKTTRFEGHLTAVAGLAFAPDGKSITTAGHDQRILWWDSVTGKETRQLQLSDDDARYYGGGGGPVRSYAISPNGEMAVSHSNYGNGGLRLWNLKSGRPICDFEGPQAYNQIGVAFSPDSRKLAATGARTPLHVWDISTGQEVPSMPVVNNPNVQFDGNSRVAFSQDGKTLAVHLNHYDRNTGRPVSDLILWDLDKKRENYRGQIAAANPGTIGGAGNMAFSLDNKYLAISDAGGGILLLNAATGKEWRRFNSSLRNSAFQLAFSSDGRFLAAGSAPRFLGTNQAMDEPVVELWELSSGVKRDQLKGHTGGITSMAFSPDGASLATGSMDTTTLVWDFTGKSHVKLPALKDEEMDGAWKLLAGNDAAIAATMRRLAQTPGPTVAFLTKHFLAVKAEAIDEKAIDRLITDLDRGNFKTRDAAARELTRLGERAEPALKRGLAADLGIEARRRIEKILEGVVRAQFTPEEMQAYRGVELLERIGNADAQAHLHALAKGDPIAIATKEANAALTRMKRN